MTERKKEITKTNRKTKERKGPVVEEQLAASRNIVLREDANAIVAVDKHHCTHDERKIRHKQE
jgi:hypothetical protein